MDSNSKSHKKKQGDMSSLSDMSETATMKTTTGSSSPGGRTRRVSMKLKKGFKEVKELFSPHHHHHHEHHSHDDDQQRQRRRKSGPNDTRRGPLAPVLDHLEKTKSVPIHLDISPARSFSVSRKGSSSSYSCSDLALEEESNTLAEIHQHIQEQLPEPDHHQPQPAPPAPGSEPEPEMTAQEPYNIIPASPLLPDDDDDDEEAPNPFLVDDPEEPLSDLEPEPLTPSLVPPPPTAPSPLEASPSESIALSPPSSQLPLPSEEPAAVPLLNTDKPVPAPPPPTSDTESEPEAPAVYLPQLVLPTMFLPIPNVRISSHLTWWLTRRTSVYY